MKFKSHHFLFGVIGGAIVYELYHRKMGGGSSKGGGGY
jgi:hypothetical protein